MDRGMIRTGKSHREAFDLASDACRLRHMMIDIADVRLSIRVAGERLAERLFDPMRHIAGWEGDLRDDLNDRAMIRLDAWSVEETGIPPVKGAPWVWSDQKDRRVIACHPGTEQLKRIDLARPFQKQLLPLLAEFNLWGVHGGVIAPRGSDAGLLLVGSNGSGKSTTCLAAALTGFTMVGEDCLMIRKEADGFFGYSLYRTMSLTPQSQTMFPDLPGPLRLPAGASPDSKSVLTFERPEMVTDALPIKALVFPEINGKPSGTGLCRISISDAQRRFMPGLRMMRLFDPDDRRPAFNALNRLVEDLPRYRLDLGSDIGAIPGCLSRFCREL